MDRRKVLPTLVLALSLMTAGVGAADTDVQVTLGGESVVLAQELVVYNDRTMIDVEDVAKLINGGVEEEEGVITLIASNGYQLRYKPGTNQVKTGREWITIDQGAIVNEQSSYLPLRWTLEELGYQVKWDEKNRTINVNETKTAGTFVSVAQDALTEEQKAFVEKVKQKQGVHRLGDLYVIARGEVPHPGYGLKIEKQQMSWEQLLVYVRLTEPEEGKMYPQVISYPYVVGKAELPPYTTIQFINAETGKRLFEN